MGAHLRVQVPLRAGHSEQSEAQLRKGDRAWEGNCHRWWLCSTASHNLGARQRCLCLLWRNHYIVNGQKTWTTLAQYANMIFCLVRTDRDASNQKGISFMLIDLKSPGVEVRPIVLLDGDPEVNEIFFADVRVPVENLVGEENKGWTYAKYLLTYGRTGIAGVGRARVMLNDLQHLLHDARSFFLRERENVQGLVNLLATDEISHQTALVDRQANATEDCTCFRHELLLISSGLFCPRGDP
jgi:alkylation response protein AidB-like acyl-CoA dehydrogenase